MPLPQENETKDLLQAISLHAAAFFSGFVTMALEMLIGRTFIPYFGGTIYTWGALISVFLLGMTIGYAVGGKIADRHPNMKILSIAFYLSSLTVIFVPACGDEVINSVIDRFEDLRYAALVSAIALACLPAALLAAVSPFCVRLLLDSKRHSGTVSGRLSALCTAGSILGTLGTSFFFIPNFGMRSMYVLLAGTSLFFGILLWLLARKGAHRPILGKKSVSCIGIGIGLAITMAGFPPSAFAQPMSALRGNDGLLERVDSEYNTIFVVKQGSQISLNFGYRNNRYIESIIDLSHHDDLVVTYTRYMTAAVAFNPNPVRKIALVGLGGGRTISYLVSSLQNSVADVAELDPAVVGIAQKYFGIEPTERLRIHAKDGRIFLNQSKEKYDLVLLDAYRGPFVPFHLTTQEFYRLVKNRLNDGGVVAQNVDRTTMFLDHAYITMKSVFDQVDFLEAGENIVLVGYAGKHLSDQELARRADSAQSRHGFKYDLRELVKARKIVQSSHSASILTDDFAPVENLTTIKRHNEKRE